ncbi:MAG: metallophosphoesterase [Marinifilaceae bacterium]|jgi:hypothetical protein|nr:metallophosphoesterase [Marinifilaceae bacterium]
MKNIKEKKKLGYRRLFLFLGLLMLCGGIYFYLDLDNLSINITKNNDGPFVFNLNKNEIKIVKTHTINDSLQIVRYKQNRNKAFNCLVDNEDNDVLKLSLMDSLKSNPNTINRVDSIFVMSDIHGCANAMISLLQKNKIVDKNFNWIFGNGHLVMVGDVTDRGKNTMACLWLLYKLQKQVGERVHYLFGNHELMTLYGRYSYLNEKTKSSLKKIMKEDSKSKALKKMFSEKSELGNWIRKCNVIERIGGLLFVHAGISKDFMNLNISLDSINKIYQENCDRKSSDLKKESKEFNIIFGRMGPVWYRGMVMDYKKYYKKMSQKDFDTVLNYYNVNKIIVGHTEVDSVSYDYNKKLIRVNVHQPKIKNSNKAQALMILNGKYYRVYGNGMRKEL